jgi:hypothetical protein
MSKKAAAAETPPGAFSTNTAILSQKPFALGSVVLPHENSSKLELKMFVKRSVQTDK